MLPACWHEEALSVRLLGSVPTEGSAAPGIPGRTGAGQASGPA